MREWKVISRAASLAVLCLFGLAGYEQGRANFEGVELVCPCDVEVHADSDEASVTFGVRNYRPTGTGSLAVAARASLPASSQGVADAGGHVIAVPIEPLPQDSTLRRMTYRTALLGDIEDSVQGLTLEITESTAAQQEFTRDEVILLKPLEAAALVYSSPDFLTDIDGDGVADANEALAGTDPADPMSTPGVSSVDVLALFDGAYSRELDYAPHTRIHHLLTVANLAFEDSGTNIRLRTVGLSEASAELADDDTSLPPLAARTALLDMHGADLGIYFKGPPSASSGLAGGGFARAPKALSRGHMPAEAADEVHAIVFYAASPSVVAQNIGYMLGLGNSFDQGEVGTFPWSRGHSERRSDLGTIMSNGTGYFGFSDPDIDCWGFGTPCGVPRTEWRGADAVASLNAVRFQVARYRQAMQDSDGDQVVDAVDLFPLNDSEWQDADGDGIGDLADSDDDNDGVLDGNDAFPFNAAEWADVDRDGIGDNADSELPDPVEPPAEGFVAIADPVLRALIESALNVTPGTPVAVDDMSSITTLRANQPSGIASLEGLEFATNLRWLSLPGGEVSDLSPLSGLEKLSNLDLAHHEIADLTHLAGLGSLFILNLDGNRISDPSPLVAPGRLSRLRDLTMGRNYLDDAALEPLGALTGLQRLAINDQKRTITRVSALAQLSQLEDLDLSGNPLVRDIGPLAGLTALRTLNLASTDVADITPLAHLSLMEQLDLSRTGVSGITALTGLDALSTLVFSGNAVSDTTVLSSLRAMDSLDLRWNNITRLSRLVTPGVLSNDATLDVRQNPLSDAAYNRQIPRLEARGITVLYDPPIIEVPDQALRAALAQAAERPADAVGVSHRDVLFIRSLDLSGLGIANLAGIEHVGGLHFVNLAGNDIEDLSALLDLPLLQQVALDEALIGKASLQQTLDALRTQGVAITSAATPETLAAFEHCQPGILLGPSEYCTYPGSSVRLSVLSDGLANFLNATFAESLEVQGSIGAADYDLAASRHRRQDWRVTRVAGSDGMGGGE